MLNASALPHFEEIQAPLDPSYLGWARAKELEDGAFLPAAGANTLRLLALFAGSGVSQAAFN